MAEAVVIVAETIKIVAVDGVVEGVAEAVNEEAVLYATKIVVEMAEAHETWTEVSLSRV